MEQEFNNRNVKHRHNTVWIVFAIILILAGVLMLAFNLGWLPVAYMSVLLSWYTFLIALGILALSKRSFMGGSLLILFGGFFMLSALSKMAPELFGHNFVRFSDYWPILIIIAGVALIVKKFFCKKTKSRHFHRFSGTQSEVGRNDSDYISKDMMFNGSEQIVFSDNFQGGDLNTGFGDMKLDLRKVTQLDPANLLEINTMFGNTIIYVPKEWYINFVKSESMFGTVVDKRITMNIAGNDTSEVITRESGKTENNETCRPGAKAVLNLKCACMFGNIEIRN